MFYDGKSLDQVYQIRKDLVAQEAEDARKGLEPSHRDKNQIALFVIDEQNDFCNSKGSLFVPGSVEDTGRICQFVLSNIGKITNILCSLDTHFVYQIFHPYWWKTDKGEFPKPFTLISSEDIKTGKFIALRDPKRSLEYCEKLEKSGKKTLCIWPVHCLQGTPGHALVSSLAEVIMYHAIAKVSPTTYLAKGTLPDTENYSVLSPEVKTPHPMGQFNAPFYNTLISHDRIYISGQASSHCVLETMLDMAREFGGDRTLFEKVYVLEDCMSLVPNIEDGKGNTLVDFKKITEDTFADFKSKGMKIVKSTDLI